MSTQSLAWLRHTQAYLKGVDPNLSTMFMHALMHADYPKVPLADAFEAILADFIAGPHRQRLKPEPDRAVSGRESKGITHLYALVVAASADGYETEGILRRDTPMGTQPWITDDKQLVGTMLELAGAHVRADVTVAIFERKLDG